jgi:hypothetical protein
MIEINLRDTLNAKQYYVVELSKKLGIEIKSVKHKEVTSTCFEKAGILGWEPERIIKAIFFHHDEDIYGFVFPELGKEYPLKIDIKEVLPRLINISKKQAKNFKNSYCPSGMEYGTCTPFVFEDEFNKVNGLEKIFIHDYSKIDKELVDISIGGFGDEAHKISLHLKYKDIFIILKNKFGDRINIANLFENV